MGFYDIITEYTRDAIDGFLASVTAARVERVLEKPALSRTDFLTLLAPEAEPFLEQMARKASPVTYVDSADPPFLIMHGTSDPTVAFQNGLGFYKALRFNGKNAVLLAYPGEGHGLRGLANRKDLTVRFFEFFNHYLKDEPAPEWMTKGVPFLKKDRK